MIQELPLDFLDTALSEVGPGIAEELERQQQGLRLIGPGSASAAAPECRESFEMAEQLAD